MKKISKIIMLVMFALICAITLAACPSGDDGTGGDGGNGGNGGNKTEYYKNESKTAGTFDAKFTDVKTSSGDKMLNPAVSGKVYVGIKFELKNNSNENETISSLLCFEAKYNNEEADQSLYAPSLFGGSLDGTFTSGETKSGWYAILLPEDWETFSIKFKPDLTAANTVMFVAKKTDVSEHLDTAAKQTEVGINESATVDELEMKFTEVKVSATGAAANKVRVGVKFEVKNTATVAHTLSINRFTAKYNNETINRVTDSSFGVMIYGTNPAGQTQTGWYVVELPEDWEELTINFTDGAFSDTAIFNIKSSDVVIPE